MSRFLVGAVIGTLLALPSHSQSATLVGLTGDNQLLLIDTEKKAAAAPRPITGSEGRIVGIDVRPSDGKLYGVSSSGQIVTVSPVTGEASPVGQIAEKIELGDRPVVDFNPVADRLRVITGAGSSLRINVDTGQTVIDKPLAFDPADANGSKRPAIAAGAYINAVPGAKTTELLHVDAGLGALLLQNPPNDGILKTKGLLGIAIQPTAAMDILADGKGGNLAFLISDNTLYSIDLDTAKAKELGLISGMAASVVDIAVLPQ